MALAGWTLVTVAAPDDELIAAVARDIADALERSHDLAGSAVAGRTNDSRLRSRWSLVCDTAEEAVRALRVLSVSSASRRAPVRDGVAFMFPGGGAQHRDMAVELYSGSATFRSRVDRCDAHLESLGLAGIGEAVAGHAEAARSIDAPVVGLAALFVVEYALAGLLEAAGVRPASVIGHSLGEYAAAVVAGMLPLEDALRLVTVRGRLFERLPGGGMISVPAPAATVVPLLGEHASIAAVNTPNHCVVSGSQAAVEDVERALAERGVAARRIVFAAAAHSPLVDGVLAEFAEACRVVETRAPLIPTVSNVTGAWFPAGEAPRPEYWIRHLREPVRFADGCATLLASPSSALVEVGPGTTLATLARQNGGADRLILPTLGHPLDKLSGARTLLSAVGELWRAGVEIDWPSLDGDAT